MNGALYITVQKRLLKITEDKHKDCCYILPDPFVKYKWIHFSMKCKGKYITVILEPKTSFKIAMQLCEQVKYMEDIIGL